MTFTRAIAWLSYAYVLLTVSSSPAHAYLDPGTGSILMQAVIGTIAAGAAVLVGMREKVGAAFHRLTGKSRPGRGSESSKTREDRE